MYEPLMGSFAILTHVIGFSPDVILAFGMPVLSGFVALCVYLVLKPYGKKYAIIGSILFLISIVQYKTFWLSYLKQILGIIFMLVGISMFDKKKYFLLIPLLIAAFSIQRPT